MNRFKSLLPIALSLMLTGCVTDMDPFEGGDGVRVNINGQKCVMYGIPGGYYATLEAANDVSTFQADITMMSAITDVHINYVVPEMTQIERSVFRLHFDIRDNNAFVREQKYQIHASGTKTASLIVPEQNVDTQSSEEVVALKGWAYFLSLGNVVEVRFELNGTGADGKDYALRHGYLRLHQKKEQQ